jgi:RNA-directed DNA polymerase
MSRWPAQPFTPPVGQTGLKLEIAHSVGGVISPLLANIYLHPLDLYWEQQVKATKMVRYADDIVVLCRWKPAETYMPRLRSFLGRLRLAVNEEKTHIVAAEEGFDFLGVHFRKQPTRRDPTRSFCYAWPSRRSMQRIRDKVREAISHDDRPSLEEKIGRLNPVLRGWGAYFGWLNSAHHFRKVDTYVWYKLRRWLRRKHKRVGRAFWSTPLTCFEQAGLCSLHGTIAHTS